MIRVGNACVTYVIKTAKCLKIDNMKALFPLKDKEHDKILKFKVTKAKTERFRSSPVIYMQKLLNKENLRNLKSCKMYYPSVYCDGFNG